MSARDHIPLAPANWPPHVRYLDAPARSPNLSDQQIRHLQGSSTLELSRVKIPLQKPVHIAIVPIKDDSHPAFGQSGLFATVDLAPSTLVVPYLGYVHSNVASDTDEMSDYDLSLDREAGLSVDASRMGNEARMLNDYRGVPRLNRTRMANEPASGGRMKDEKPGPNAEFRDLVFEHEDGDCELGIGVFVLPAGKSGKRKGGILKGEEILVNYGKGFWKARNAEPESST